MSIMDRCDRLAGSPKVGRAAGGHPTRPQTTTCHGRRALIAFAISDTTIEIIGVHYGGRDIDAILAADDG